ncbi:MAG: hypothetical protein GPJ51_04360 [Candidatus Heimdallarchaeota archaeon]|nr:hypothetical protein [Candidatus Heimdallarchaeota archaeon]
MSDSNLIKLINPILIARVPREEYTENLTLQNVLSAKKDNMNKFWDEKIALIITFIVSIGFLIPAAIYDMVSVFRSSENYSQILLLPLNTQFKLFLYFSFQFGIILFIALIFYSALRYYLIQVNYSPTNYKYNCIKNEDLLYILLNEENCLDEIIFSKWKTAANFDENHQTEENLHSGEREYFLFFAKDYWNCQFAIQPEFKEKLSMICIPFFLMSTIIILVPYIQKIKGNYSFIIVLIIPVFVVIVVLILLLIEKKIKKPLGYIVTVLILLAFIVNNIMVVLFIIYTNIFAFTTNTKKPGFIASYYNISLFAFYFYSFLVILSVLGSLVDRKKQIRSFKQHYKKQIIRIEKTVAQTTNDNGDLNGKLILFYKKQSVFEKASILPLNFGKYIVGFTTYLGFISLISAIFTYILNTL